MGNNQKHQKIKVLLIWTSSDTTELYLIEDAPSWLAKCHNCWINTGDGEEIDGLLWIVRDALAEVEYCVNPKHELASRWRSLEIGAANEAPLVKGVMQIVICGPEL